MNKMAGVLATTAFLTSCSVGPTVPKGQVTVQGRGAEALTNQGDPLLDTGGDEKKIPLEFAKGYAKGISDQVKRTYWHSRRVNAPALRTTKAKLNIITRRSRSTRMRTVSYAFNVRSSFQSSSKLCDLNYSCLLSV